MVAAIFGSKRKEEQIRLRPVDLWGGEKMASTTRLMLCASAVAIASQLATAPPARAENSFSKLDLAPAKKGGIQDMQDISKYCGTKPLKVAYSDGWGGNYWRQITRAEFENEASKCPNITEVRYTDGEFKAEKQIADIKGLIAQHFDVILVFADTGVAQLKVMREALNAGVAVVPFSTGDAPFGEIGKDYLTRVTETQIGLGEKTAQWMVKTLDGKGNVVVHGGTPGNPMTSSQAVGWR
jgi:ribose transport system substrate-binding protein